MTVNVLTPPPPNTLYRQTVLDDNPVYYWSFETLDGLVEELRQLKVHAVLAVVTRSS